MLAAHPGIAMASDPYARLFKAFRNSVAGQIFDPADLDPEAPLDDYYFYPQKQDLMTRIQETPLDLPSDDVDLTALRAQIANASRPYSPRIAPFLGNLQGDTFANLLASGLEIVRRAYGSEETRLVGFKEVWAGEFAGHVLNRFHGARVIHVIRDPRAVCASKNATNAKYQWIFLARQWRKLATFAWLNRDAYREDRVLLVQFEELVSNPLTESKRICEFLEIEFDEALTDPVGFVSGDGTPWFQNSSHFIGKQEFNASSVDKWHEVLTDMQVEFIEGICFAEMCMFGYQCVAADGVGMSSQLVFEPLEVAMDELAEWIRPHSFSNTEALMREIALEYVRGSVLTNGQPVSDDVKRRLCLNPEFFDAARRTCQGVAAGS